MIPYERLFRIETFPPGTFIFTDLDRLSDPVMAKVTAFANALSTDQPHMGILNRPDRFQGRFDLLRRLEAQGHGHIAVHRLSDWKSVTRFPVFIRLDRDHKRPLSGLIQDRDALGKAAVPLLKGAKDPHDLIVVEFRAKPDGKGIYRKYGAFRVGDVVYSQHVFHSKDWYIKYSNYGSSEAEIEERKNYVTDNPHAARLIPYFDAAGIDYGRIDYSLIDGDIEVYEINTNPTVIQQPPSRFYTYDPYPYAVMHNDAMAMLPDLEGQAMAMPAGFAEPGGTLTVDSVQAEVIGSLSRRMAWRMLRRHFRHEVKRISGR